MGRKKRNTIQKSVHMHINVVPTVREIAKYLSDIEIEKEKSEEFINNQKTK